MKRTALVVGCVSAFLVGVISAAEISRIHIRGVVDQTIHERNLATEADIDRILAELRQIRQDIRSIK